ncbi:MAG: S8 family peptidase [Anaerolineales bacterium]|jgi:serine protease AprX
MDDTHRQNNIKQVLSISLIVLLVFSFLAIPGSVSSQNTGTTASYIVQGLDSGQVARAVETRGGIVTSRLDIIDGVGALLTPQMVNALRSDPAIRAITANRSVETSGKGGDNIPASDYPDAVGANEVWSQGDLGVGVTVAVVDTGIGWHQGLFKGLDGKNSGRILAWKDFVGNFSTPHDPNGHGTHVAGIIANSQKGADGEWDGVAPGVSLVGVRVLNQQGFGTYETVIKGVQWVVENMDQYHIRVMNLSMVAPVQSPYWADPLDQAVMKAWASGITVVTAAGNDGPGPMTISVPGNNPYVITVGAFTDNYTPDDWGDDYIAPFSAAGPTLDGFVKPDLVAPGAHMVSTMLPSSDIARDHDANWITSMYFSMAGTSMSSAVVSGAAALILAQNPGLTPEQVKYRLMATAFPWVDAQTTDALYSMWQQGAGRLNVPDAVTTDLDGSANAGMDINADLKGEVHYEGYTIYDEDQGVFRLQGELADINSTYGIWDGKYGLWSGKYGIWSGKYGIWSGKYGIWSGKYGLWSGAYGIWSGKYGLWSGNYGIWSGKYGLWSGGYGLWSGGYGLWSGNEPWAGSIFSNATFVEQFMAGNSPDSATTTASVDWVKEP